MARQYLERPHPLGFWTALPIELPVVSEGPPAPENAFGDGSEQPPDERETAAKDPLSGLLQMQVPH